MSMNISQSMLPEFDVEVANTRRTLERVPEGNPDFRPHPKSMTMARLAGHVAEIPMWAVMTLAQDELDMRPAGGQVVMALPRVAVMRSFVMNHMVHHRAQLGVYLRMNDIAVPSIYGPSADEGGM
jgi:hypothetical protein